MMFTVDRDPPPAELRKFGGAMLLGFSVIGLVLWYFGPDPNGWGWDPVYPKKMALGAWILGALLLLVSFGPRGLARPVYVGWMSAAMGIGTVMTFVMLTVLFIVLLPVFSLIRLKDPLRIKLKAKGESYWEDHEHHESTLERTIRPF
ncbi:MAG: hypothetical protein GY842_24410 [bacterium]|nr:hypothetical protein [bacterium]